MPQYMMLIYTPTEAAPRRSNYRPSTSLECLHAGSGGCRVMVSGDALEGIDPPRPCASAAARRF